MPATSPTCTSTSTLLALLAALKRKDSGFLYLETHAGRGAYDLAQPSTEATRAAQAGLARLAAAKPERRSCAGT